MGVMSATMPPALPGGWEHDCGPDKVPGWLNEEGLPTVCVDDNPQPDFTAEPAPVEPDETLEIYPSPLPLDPLPEALPANGEVLHPPQVHVRDTLAETGADVAGWVLAGVLLIAVGLFVALNEWRTK